MPDILKLDKSNKIITIQSHGVVTRDDIEESIIKINELFKNGVVDKVLVDASGQIKIPDLGSFYKLSDKFANGIRIAVYTKIDLSNSKDLEFFELTSRNKGKVLKVFYDMEEAKQWLFE
ncbi:hypothetical protein OAA06_02065 [bacterium]|nr:hypothetical protein [bacterium]